MPELTKPTCHLNGTSANDLVEGYADAIRALNNAMEKIQATSPNGRDYYVQGDSALGAAQAEHRARMVKLNAVSDELFTLAEHCAQYAK